MCGVIGLIYERYHGQLGRIAADLLKTLEYRGYDSTGAVVQGAGLKIELVKGVGAPSVMVDELGIVDMAGQIFCGQVRWATFGAVNDANSQPHLVSCRGRILYGAHNGNVTNCDELQGWLASEGHQVVSDNDGEVVVHAVEHYFAQELDKSAGDEPEERRRSMRRALVRASARLEGSFAAVVVDPEIRTVWAAKRGSSLYFGLGSDEVGGRFGIASSDLSSVLKLTRVVVPLGAGEMVEYTPERYRVFGVEDRVVKARAGEVLVRAGEEIEREPVRSRLRVKDTALVPPFETFMDQEISAQEQTCRNVVRLFGGGSRAQQLLGPYVDQRGAEQIGQISDALDELRDQYSDEQIRARFHALVDDKLGELLGSVPERIKRAMTDAIPEQLADRLASAEAGFFTDLLPMARGVDDLVAVRVFDLLLERGEIGELAAASDRFVEICLESAARGGRIYVVCCGSSYHAAKAAALFFNEIARTELIPILPGEFRGQYSKALSDGDLFIAVSQSGETKDLIDVMDQVIASELQIHRVAIVNNVNSTLAQEKSELTIPLRCGPEIAVPATKSFVNQMLVLYCLSLKLGQARLELAAPAQGEQLREELEDRLEKLPNLPALIRETFDSTEADVEKAAQQLFLCPSIHILATRIIAVALEGALKVREVVLNHTEGSEGSEFKHGPNTILGFNTIFGPLEVDGLLKKVGRTLDAAIEAVAERGLDEASMRRLAQAITDAVFSPTSTPFSLKAEEQEVLRMTLDRDDLVDELYADYPLIYVTGPEEQDVHLTVSQINTHKIRGASTMVVAEDHPALRQAAAKAPADNPTYRSVFVALPRTNDTLMTVFSSTVVLQRLALKMSLLKKQYLDRLGVKNHGVHPDVPKNVSKSITVD